MRLQNLAVWSWSSALLLLVLSGCGSTPSVGSQPLTQAQANDLKTVAPYLGSALVSGLRGGGKGVVGQTLKQSYLGGTCSVSAPANSDKDQDGIPVNFKASFQDCTEDKLLFIQVTNGNVSINDANDNDPQSGFTSKATDLRFDFYTNKGGGNKGPQLFRMVDNWEVTVGVTSASASVDYQFSVALTRFNNGAADKTWNGSLRFTGSYIPENDGNLDRFDAGTLNLRGTLALGEFVLNETVSDLKFNSSCTAGPIAGKIRFDDGLGNFLELTYTGCNSGTFTYNASGSGSF